jgi:hypothetical protein
MEYQLLMQPADAQLCTWCVPHGAEKEVCEIGSWLPSKPYKLSDGAVHIIGRSTAASTAQGLNILTN